MRMQSLLDSVYKRMKIGFDISQTGPMKAGCGYFSHTMICSLAAIDQQNNYSLFPSFGDFYFDYIMPLINPYGGKNLQYGPRHLLRNSASNFWRSRNLEGLLGNLDIIHSNNFWCPLQLKDSRLVYTLYDMSFMDFPSYTTEANRIYCVEGVFNASLAADAVIAISEFTKRSFLSIFPHFPKISIKVIYPNTRFTGSQLRGIKPKILENVSSEKFWLSVGTIEPRKNQRQLAQSYARYLKLGGIPYPLVFAGGKGWLMEDFEDYLLELGIRDHVVLTGYVSDEELIWLYRNCYANLYLSLFEGLGLPVLEGMQFGAATLASNSSSIPEVAGDAAILLDPSDVELWGQTMIKLSKNSNQRDSLKQKSLEQAMKFDWQQSAIALLEIYQSVLETPKRNGQRL
jgi:glycosyltransferase involved in cell wall biosynthesis